MTPSTPVAIIGGGLAGLAAARLLHAAGIDFRVFEARDRLGGRILSVDRDGRPSGDGFDLGPSWFWPGLQPRMARLAEDLGLAAFVQRSEGDIVVERMSHEPPQRYRGYAQQPASFRLSGGTGALVAALAAALPEDRLHLNTRVDGLRLDGAGLRLSATRADGTMLAIEARHAILALPPRLLAASVAFAPPIDPSTLARWQATPTWMAPHAKFFALYDSAFWREAGLSGTAQSMVGPLVEIHEATTASGRAALFGFLGPGADRRAAIGAATLVEACVGQFGRLFGPAAARPTATLFKDWAADPLTATPEDRQGGAHPVPDRRPWIDRPWQWRVALAGSETGPHNPGYLEGALEAAARAVAELAIITDRSIPTC